MTLSATEEKDAIDRLREAELELERAVHGEEADAGDVYEEEAEAEDEGGGAAEETPATGASASGRKRRLKLIKPNAKIWDEIKRMYELGTYSQKQLAAYAKAQGYRLSQSSVSRRALQEEWMTVAMRERIAKEEKEKALEDLGDDLTAMLARHRQLAQVVTYEVNLIIKKNAKARETDPTFTMPPQAIATLAETIGKLTKIEARAAGFNYDTGTTFAAVTKSKETQQQTMSVEVMTPEQAEAVRKDAESGISDD